MFFQCQFRSELTPLAVAAGNDMTVVHVAVGFLLCGALRCRIGAVQTIVSPQSATEKPHISHAKDLTFQEMNRRLFRLRCKLLKDGLHVPVKKLVIPSYVEDRHRPVSKKFHSGRAVVNVTGKNEKLCVWRRCNKPFAREVRGDSF